MPISTNSTTMAKVFVVVLFSLVSIACGAAIIDPVVGIKGPFGFTGRSFKNVLIGDSIKPKLFADDIFGTDIIGASGLSRKDVVLKSFCDAFAIDNIKCKVNVNDILKALVSGAPEFADAALLSYCDTLPIDTFKCKVVVDDIFKADVLGAPELADAGLKTLGDALTAKTMKRGFFGVDDTESLKMVAADAAKRSLDDASIADAMNRKALAADSFGAEISEALKIAGAEAAKRSLENALIADAINRKIPTDIFSAEAIEALKIVAADTAKKTFENVLAADVLDRKALAADMFSADATGKLKMVAADAAVKTSEDALNADSIDRKILAADTFGIGIGKLRGLTGTGFADRRFGGVFAKPLDLLLAKKIATGDLRRWL